MNKTNYKGNDAPVSLSITNLVSASVTIICLGIATKEIEESEEYPEGKEYSYTCITDELQYPVTIDSIIQTIADADSLELVDKTFIDALARHFSLDENGMLNVAKKFAVTAIEQYDDCDYINTFSLNGIDIRIRLEERKSMRQSLIALKSEGIEQFTYWYGNTPITLPVDTFADIMNKYEVYALTCFNVTAQHKTEVLSLDSIDSILAYDIRSGYPDKLSF